MSSKDCKITPACVLAPLSLLAFVVFVMLAFQTSQVLRDRATLREARAQQDKPLEEALKVQAQVNALASGTLKLSQAGNKDAKAIIDRMRQLGITVNGDKSAAAPAATDAKPTAPATEPTPETSQ